MVRWCAIYTCHSRSTTDRIKLGYYAIPTVRVYEGEQTEELSRKRRALWLSRINRKDYTPSKHAAVCSHHFVTGKPSALYDQTNPDWAPSLKLSTSNTEHEGKDMNLKRYQRKRKRKRTQTKKDYETAESLLDLFNSITVPILEDPKPAFCSFFKLGPLAKQEPDFQHKDTQTDKDPDMIGKLKEEYINLETFRVVNELKANQKHMQDDIDKLKLALRSRERILKFKKRQRKRMEDLKKVRDVRKKKMELDRRMRMEKLQAEKLLRMRLRRARKSVPADERLATTLWRLGTNIEYRSIGHLFGRAKSTCVNIVKEVTVAIVKYLLLKYIRLPQGDELLKVMAKFERRCGFPQIGGAIDGTHVKVLAPHDGHSDYYSRHHIYSVILQAVVDCDSKFLDVCIGWPGKAHDARIFKNSNMYRAGITGKLFPDHLKKKQYRR
ncbi:Protein ALP1-like [Nymphon striatum]|nr:Protein ALP1-like [Nymphon striatum]